MSNRKFLAYGGAVVIMYGLELLIQIFESSTNNSIGDNSPSASVSPTPSVATEISPSVKNSASVPAIATTLPEQYAAISEEALDKMVKAAAQRDTAALGELEQAGLIFPLYPNQQVYITGCHGLICSKVSFRYEGKNDELWTYTEAIKQ
jgi:hypothetical protein